MSDIDKMARELLPDELCFYGHEANDLSTVVSFAAALNAIRAALLNAPPGWKLVPVEPSPGMWRAAHECGVPYPSMVDYYRAMLAAAPEPK